MSSCSRAACPNISTRGSAPPSVIWGRPWVRLSGAACATTRSPFGPSHSELTLLGQGLVQALDGRQAPVVLAFDRDIARLMGRLLLEELRAKLNLVAVDELELGAFDYIDVGEPLPVSGVVPVVVKSLVFRPTSTETLLE